MTLPLAADHAFADVEMVMVTFHSRDHVRGFLESVGPEIPLVLIDNSAGADDVAGVVTNRPGTRYLTGPGRGFATAANIGARTSTAEYLIFVNPDSRPTREVLLALVADLREASDLGCVAALLTGADGQGERGAGGWEPSPRRALVHAAGLHKWFRSAGLYARPRPYELVDVDWVVGACTAVRRPEFLALGAFDESYFVYSEDVDWSRRLRAAGYRVRLRTDLLVPHSAGSSGGTSSTTMSRIKGASFAAYTRRHVGGAAATCVVAVEALGAIGRTVLYLLTARTGTARSMAAYARGLLLGAEPPIGSAT
jgi:GT2 family glycosyltransferase